MLGLLEPSVNVSLQDKKCTFMCTVCPVLKEVGKCSPTRRLTKETCLEFMLGDFGVMWASQINTHTRTKAARISQMMQSDERIPWLQFWADLIFFHTGNYISMERDRTEIKTVLAPIAAFHPVPHLSLPGPVRHFYPSPLYLINIVAFSGWVSSNVLQSSWDHNELL